MKTAIVYYSMSDNCKMVAEKIAEKLGADTIRIEPEKAYPDKGAKKFLWGGKSAVMGDEPKLKPYTFNAADYDRIIIGSPVWASRPAPPIKTFIKENAASLSGKKFAAFATMSGDSAGKTFDRLKDMLGTDALEATLELTDPAVKKKDEDEKAIEAFCGKLT